MKNRVFASIAVIFAWKLLAFLMVPLAPLVAASAAGGQFANSDLAFAANAWTQGLMATGGGLSMALLLIVLAFIWWKPAAVYFKALAVPLLIVASLVAASTLPSFAYYDKNDYAEAFFVLPNESAFFIPDVGANKDSQVAFGSQAYYEQSKIPAKRFVIPHTKFAGSGTFSDYYVPAGRLIVVDRTPYNQEWTGGADRGTSAKNESFPCQSSEGLNVTIEMGVAASVTEENAAKFLYHFGTKPPKGDRADPLVTFTSVYYGRSLSDVMGSVGRGEIQTLACAEVSGRTLDNANAQAPAILTAIQTNAKKWFSDYGITIDYLGWAGTFTFDQRVQDALNDRYAADKLQPVLATLQVNADIKVKEGLGDGLRTHGLPASMIAIPTDLINNLASLFVGSAKTAAQGGK